MRIQQIQNDHVLTLLHPPPTEFWTKSHNWLQKYTYYLTVVIGLHTLGPTREVSLKDAVDRE